MKLLEKLLQIQQEVDSFVKDNVVGEGKSSYKAVGGEQVLNKIRPLMNSLGLLLEPGVTGHNVISGTTSSGTARYFTEIDMTMTWVDVESGETRPVPWYAQGVDLAGEKGVGKAYTYAEKYFLLKYFHVPTEKDDPDADTRNKSGELKQKGTAAAKETADYCRKAIWQMLVEIYATEDKAADALQVLTQSAERGLSGVHKVADLTDASAQVTYGRIKDAYKKRMGKDFTFKTEEPDDEA